MSIRFRLFLLLLTLSSALLGGVWVWYQDDQDQADRLLKGARRDHDALIDEIRGLYGRDIESFAADYARWTELGNDIERPQPGWAATNVDGGLTSFKADALWLYDAKGRLVHFGSAEGRQGLRSALDGAFSPPTIMPRGKPLAHFFVRRGAETIEIRGASVVDSTADRHKAVPRGYLLIARVWNTKRLVQLSKVLGATITLEDRPGRFSGLASAREMTHERALVGVSGTPIAWLRIEFPHSPLSNMGAEVRRETLWILGGSLTILGLFGAFTAAWVTKPLRQIVTGLAEGRPEAVAGLAEKPGEFGQVARLVLESFAHKQELQDREEQKAAVLESAIDAVITMDSEGRILEFNGAAEAMFGVLRHAVLGLDLAEVIIPERYREAHSRGVMRHRGPLSKRVEVSALRADGSEFPVEISLTCVPREDTHVYTGFIRDLSEQRRLEEQLSNARKMESLGLLASGVAHEINTPMQYVLDNTKFLAESCASLTELLGDYRALRRAVENSPEHADQAARIVAREAEMDAEFLTEELPLAVEESLRGIDRVRKIVRAMRQMAHPGDEAMRPASLNAVLDDAVALVRNDAKHVADLEVRLAPDLPEVLCDPGEIGQVAVNLLVNAIHAIAEVDAGGKRGKIVLETRSVGDHAEIVVSDDGPGIPDSIRHRIFDPFFTTKPVGKGTGQGLAIVFSIVQRHGGRIDFAKNRDGGTTFVVALPLPQAVAA